LSLLPQPHTEIMYRFLAPVLSAQFMTAATGRPSDMENLFPEVPPLPLFDILATCAGQLPMSQATGGRLRNRRPKAYLSACGDSTHYRKEDESWAAVD
jgi:hypothetical protein